MRFDLAGSVQSVVIGVGGCDLEFLGHTCAHMVLLHQKPDQTLGNRPALCMKTLCDLGVAVAAVTVKKVPRNP
nr:hypothetical protein [Cytobacillus oceanisediminis]